MVNIMAIGGGTFTSQNKILPGSYLNFVSASRANANLSDRGAAAMALELDWGPDGEVFSVFAEDFQKNARTVFGYTASDDKMKGLNDLFKNIRVGHFYRVNSGTKALCSYADAKYSGIRGNNLKVVIRKNVDDATKFDVVTVLDDVQMDVQTVSTTAELIANDFLVFKTAPLAVTAGIPLTGGTNAASVTGANYQEFLNKIEAYSFNTLACLSTDNAIKTMLVQFTKRMRDELGVKFQTVLYRQAADYEGVVSVENQVIGDMESALVYWVTGIEAGASVNKSCMNRIYDGMFTVNADYTQTALAAAIRAGKFLLHKTGDTLRVLSDNNSFVSINTDKNADFSDNQVIRVLDQIGNDIAAMFNTRYLGSVPNDAAGRVSLWNDIVRHHQQLQGIRAIEEFLPENITVESGETKKSVIVRDTITPVSAMAQLYMTVVVQ